MESVKRVDLICCHHYGMTKYRQLDREYPMEESVQPIPDDRQQEILALFQTYGLQAQLGG